MVGVDWSDFVEAKKELNSLGRKGASKRKAWLFSVYNSLEGEVKEAVDKLKQELMSWPDIGEISALELIFTLAVLLKAEQESNKRSWLGDFFYIFKR